MSTHSWICREYPDGTVRGIYCHFDGYLSGVGRTLYEHYVTPDLVDALITLGDISYVRKNVAPPEFANHSFATPEPDVTVAYHRDRGEPLRITTWKTIDDFERNAELMDYFYVFTNGRWFYAVGDRPVKWFSLTETFKL